MARFASGTLDSETNRSRHFGRLSGATAESHRPFAADAANETPASSFLAGGLPRGESRRCRDTGVRRPGAMYGAPVPRTPLDRPRVPARPERHLVRPSYLLKYKTRSEASARAKIIQR